MELRAIIIDDEQNGINALKILIKRYANHVKVVAETTTASQGVELIEDYKPEIVFLDINMPEMDGFQLLEKLRWKNFSLVFTTAHEEYALRALKVDALDYLLKPIDYHELQKTITKIQSQLEDKKILTDGVDWDRLAHSISHIARKKIKVNSKSGIEYIDAADIIYLESFSNDITIFLSDSHTVQTTKSLREFEIELCESEKEFVRVHNSYIINCNKIIRFHKGEDLLVMSNDHKIPIAKGRKDTFLEWFKSINGTL